MGVPFFNSPMLSKYGNFYSTVDDNEQGGLTKIFTKMTEQGDLQLDGFIIASRYENMHFAPFGGIRITVG